MTRQLHTITIIPGFAEGPWHVRRLQRSLEKLGYHYVADTTQADIVVAHSAGCFYIPERVPGQLLVLIGPPYWPGKSGSRATLQKTIWDFQAAWRNHTLPFLIVKTCWNWYYMLNGLARTRHIIRTARDHNFHTALSGHNVAVIRNDHDAYLTPELHESLPDEEFFNFYHVPGEHDDLWLYSDRHAAKIDEIVHDFATIQR